MVITCLTVRMWSTDPDYCSHFVSSTYRPARDPTASVSTSGRTSKARWWSSARTVSRCRSTSGAEISTPATSWTATGPSTSTQTSVAASTLSVLASTANSVTGGQPAPPPAHSEGSQSFKPLIYWYKQHDETRANLIKLVVIKNLIKWTNVNYFLVDIEKANQWYRALRQHSFRSIALNKAYCFQDLLLDSQTRVY